MTQDDLVAQARTVRAALDRWQKRAGHAGQDESRKLAVALHREVSSLLDRIDPPQDAAA